MAVQAVQHKPLLCALTWSNAKHFWDSVLRQGRAYAEATAKRLVGISAALNEGHIKPNRSGVQPVAEGYGHSTANRLTNLSSCKICLMIYDSKQSVQHGALFVWWLGYVGVPTHTPTPCKARFVWAPVMRAPSDNPCPQSLTKRPRKRSLGALARIQAILPSHLGEIRGIPWCLNLQALRMPGHWTRGSVRLRKSMPCTQILETSAVVSP